MKRARLLVLASTVSMLGWGAILPYQYAYAANTRHWGGLVAAAASSLFSIGALVAAPIGGRLADRFNPARVVVVAQIVAALASAFLIVAGTPVLFLMGMFVFGAGITAAIPVQTILVLRWVDSADRRRVFALLFTGSAIGMAIGAFTAGFLVDLKAVNGMWPAFATAAIGFLVSAIVIGTAGRGAPVDEVEAPQDTPSGSAGTAIRIILATPALRWTAVITATLALGFYAQFESGLPAYAITVLGVSERTIGTAAAVNCLVIIALQMAVMKWTAKRSSPSLLVAVGSIWVFSWLLLAAASFLPALAGAMFVGVYGVFAVGETMYAPVLNPLTASLAPAGMVGTTLGIFAALQTGVSAVGPLLAGVALSAGHGSLFVAVHVGISLIAVFAALRLRALLSRSRASEPGGMPQRGKPASSDESAAEGELRGLTLPQAA
ncbi:MAG TPA: MFS transporter [Dermatophilaceae bacterium]|nr:MFS transporter [Dermatophilaceae bacterium]